MNSFEKRVKRNVTGRDHTFYLTVTPGFEQTAEAELADMGIQRSGPIETGGFEFTGRVTACMRVNLFSRCAVRVLMRLVSFRARRFHSIYEKSAKFPWELYLDPSAEIKFKTASSGSRLYHTGRVAVELQRGIKARFSGSGGDAPCRKSTPRTVFCRLDADLCTLSLDSSGDPLFKRGYKTGAVRAPLRENIAAAILLEAGAGEADIIFDGMCGSGTFSTEAAGILTGKPAGIARTFAFESWPCFSESAFAHMKKSAIEAPSAKGPGAVKIITADIDPAAVDAALKNIQSAGFGTMIVPVTADFFAYDIPPAAAGRSLVVLNPPYGERLITEDLPEFYRRIGARLKTSFKGWDFAVIVPDAACEKAAGLECDKKISFRNGGLRVTALFGSIPA
jgi:putative N6-adenine-specific DNA methylase